MITAVFYKKGREFSGFRVSGHAGYDEYGLDIACASVSSAVELSANLITEIFHISADVKVSEDADNAVTLKIAETCEEDQKQNASKVIEGLKLHLELLSEEFEKTIKTEISEV